MGKNNRQRRRQKQSTKTRRGPTASTHRAIPRPDDPQFSAEGFALLAEAIASEQHAMADELVAPLAEMWDAGVADAASEALRAAITLAWENGWQPADLVHAFGRKLPATDRRLLVAAVVADGPTWRAHAAADQLWIDQVDDLEVDLAGSSSPGTRTTDADMAGGIVACWMKTERLATVDALLRAATLVAQLWRMPLLPPVGDPPSAWGRRPRSPSAARSGSGHTSIGGIDERILGRVRALLAKAESTEFAPEAEALTAKAQELMARYAIDQALVSAGANDGRGTGEQPRSRRVLIHDPYAKGKSYLLAEVAGVNRCQAVWAKEFGISTVFGFATDLAVTDILYTSLVSQCSTAMVAASKTVSNPRSFRESFVLSFAIHIGERLTAATAATLAEARAELGDTFLPVLATRTEQVDAARDEAFPNLRSNPIRVTDRQGWAAGQAAAELARLDVGRAVEG